MPQGCTCISVYTIGIAIPPYYLPGKDNTTSPRSPNYFGHTPHYSVLGSFFSLLNIFCPPMHELMTHKENMNVNDAD